MRRLLELSGSAGGITRASARTGAEGGADKRACQGMQAAFKARTVGETEKPREDSVGLASGQSLTHFRLVVSRAMRSQ